MLANYHTHTHRCKHATGEDREYVESAIKNGMKVLGFSDHCPWVYEDDYVSSSRMFPYQLDDYFYSLKSLKEEYKKDITIYIGFESEYIEVLLDKQKEILRHYPIDYMILGQHSTGVENRSPFTGNLTEDENILAEYVRLCIAGLETKAYRYVAHPDMVRYVGDAEIYHFHMSKLCKYLKEHQIPIEINMLGLMGNKHYPNRNFLSIAQEYGNLAIVGVDAHSPDKLMDTEGHSRCRSLAKEYGLTLIDYIEGLGPKNIN